MAGKEASARIKINRLLEESGWRFFDTSEGYANIVLEPNVKLTESQVNDLGEDFEKTANGFVDFLLLDDRGFPLIVLEAKKENIEPLIAKEQARKYARALNCRFVILSNGNVHYFWDLDHGNPVIITRFPSGSAASSYKKFAPDPKKLVAEVIQEDYIALTQHPTYAKEAGWINENERADFLEKNGIRLMRPYQVQAVEAIQKATREGKTRYLFEMATGTGKTLTAAAVIKLFLKTGNARRVLFLVDRLELEDQALKAFKKLLKQDYASVIFKENREDWMKAEIVVTTVQSLLFDNKYRKLFNPTDFDLVISDEAHRSIGGNARAVFEYFVGYKLGLTATPRDYLKHFDPDKPATKDPREAEKRLLLDTYRTFGCESGIPTFRYSLLDGVKQGYLINPYVVDARTAITTELLSEEGYAVAVPTGPDESGEDPFGASDFEHRFFSEPTNRTFCKTIMEGGLRDPVTGEFGKCIVFAVSQKHAAKIVQILNEMADQVFPGKYSSDFAIQITSSVPSAQQFTINFTNNRLSGTGNFDSDYQTSKTRVAVTVGMMTTGYDCTDLLNIALMRPVFSPSDFVQIKGRGTRKHNHLLELRDKSRTDDIAEPKKTRFKFFDFFANCQYFEDMFQYDEVIKLPVGPHVDKPNPPINPPVVVGTYENFDPDDILTVREHQVGYEGMKIDRMLFERFEDAVRADETLTQQIAEGQWDQATEYVTEHIFNRPEDFYNLEKLRKAAGVDRRLTLRELLEKAVGRITKFKSKDELLDEEFEKLILDLKPEEVKNLQALKYYFKAYISDSHVRDIIETKNLTALNVNPTFGMKDFKAVPEAWRQRIPEYVKDYVTLNRFM